jgi:threonine synthase
LKYISTRGRIDAIDFRRAVLMGLADDGGLIIPQSIPNVADRLEIWRKLSYPQLAFEVIRLFAADIPEADLRGLIDRTYGRAFPEDVVPVVRVGGLFVMELFHGPTLAFKDVALQLLGNLFEYILARRQGAMNILAATSGDTGSAAIYGVRGRRGIRIFVMHPLGAVSPIQERQMTAVLDDNVHNLAVQGSFDDCQNIMKSLAGDLEFKRKYNLGAVNSVNWARVLAQIVYYFRAALDACEAAGSKAAAVCVPTGNFGNVLAGWYARQMGAPISRLILATNCNDILARFFQTGQYSLGKVAQTLAPSMDIQVASNFERYLYYRAGSSPAALRALMDQFRKTGSLRVDSGGSGAVDPLFASAAADEQQILDAIRTTWRDHKYLLDPHSAVGVSVARRLAGGIDGPIVCLATAHPAKFPAAIRQATGEDLAHHPDIDRLMELPTRCTTVPNDAQKVRQFIVQKVASSR